MGKTREGTDWGEVEIKSAALNLFLLDIQEDALTVVNAVRRMDCKRPREIIVTSSWKL